MPKARREGDVRKITPPPKRRELLAPILVATVTIVALWPVVANQFVNWDDDKNFLDNPYFRGLGFANLRWMFTTFHLGHYHPLTWLTLGFDYTLWGLDPAGYHFTGLLLHAANAVLFYFVCRRLLGDRTWPAAVAALLFAVHPLRVESVAWASERRDVLSGLFYLLSVLWYLRAQQEGPRRRWLLASLAAFGGALLSKSIVVTLPVILLVLDWYPLRRGFRWKEKLPYFAIAAIFAVVAVARQAPGVAGAAEHVTMLVGLRAGLSLYALAFYVWKTVLPFGLYPQYVLPAGISTLDWRILAAGVFVVAISAAAVALQRRFPALLVVWKCYIISLLPVLSIFRVDVQQFAADHHTYLATLGFAVLAAAALAGLPGRTFAATATVVVLALAALSYRQAGVWRDSATLWQYTLAGQPDSVVAHNDLGEVLAAEGKLDEAARHFERAIAIRPRDAHAQYNLGRALQKQGRLEDAARYFESAVQIESAFAAAHDDLANCLAALGRKDAALEQYRLALRYQPDFADAHYNLGNLLQSQGRYEEAIQHYKQALDSQPYLADAHNNWGVALDALGRPAEAIEHYRQALVIDPRNADAHSNLGTSLAAQGKNAEAITQYREALRLNPSHADARANLDRLLKQF